MKHELCVEEAVYVFDMGINGEDNQENESEFLDGHGVHLQRCSRQEILNFQGLFQSIKESGSVRYILAM